MSAEQNKAIVRRYREVHNSNALDQLDEIVAKDIISHSALPGLPAGLEGGKIAHRAVIAAFPDCKVTIDLLIAEGDFVVERFTSTGTHKGPFMGMSATGKSFKTTGISIFRLANGKIVEHWGENDTATLMQQLGMTPMQG